jgi:hypothetical protein
MAEALWEALRQLVDASKAECDHTEGGDRPPLHGAGDASLVAPIEPLFANQPDETPAPKSTAAHDGAVLTSWNPGQPASPPPSEQ